MESIDPKNANPANCGPINFQPPQNLRPIADIERQTAQEKLQVLIDHSRRELDCLNNED